MKTKNILLAIFGICLIFLVSASLVSASIWFDFEADPYANSMTVASTQVFNLILTASSHNNVPVSLEKLEAIQGGNKYLIKSWNEPGAKYSSTYLFTKTYAFDSSVLGPGTYTLRFSAKTSAGAESADLTLIINTPPVVSISTPANGNSFTNKQTIITYTATDINGNLDKCWATDGATTTPQTSCTGSISGLNSNVGSNTWIVYARDAMGDIGSATTTFTITSDANAPSITISSPVNGNTYSAPVTQIVFTPVDAEGNLRDCWYSLNGGITQSAPFSCTDSSPTTLMGFSSVIGINNWVVYARDTFGNIASRTVSFTYTPDANAPTITISSPVNGNYYSNPVTQIDFTPVDAEGNLARCWYSLDGGASQSTSVPCTDSILNSFFGITSIEGINNWVVYALDNFGNIGSTAFLFTQDTIAPVITALDPMDKDKLNDEDVILAVSTNEGAILKYSLDGGANVTMTETSPGSLIFESSTLNLNDGDSYSVIYYANDLAGNTASLTITFEIELDENGGSSLTGDSFYNAQFIEQYNPPTPTIDLTDDEPKGLTWWQKFINWLCRLFGLEEIY